MRSLGRTLISVTGVLRRQGNTWVMKAEARDQQVAYASYTKHIQLVSH